MQLEGISVLFSFIGGLGMFLYGMHVMANGLQHFAGGKMQRLMSFLTQNRLMAILVGTLVTAVIQSSSATTVMVVGFVNAGMLNLSQAVGVIMGANIGTTITAWLVSLSEFGSFLNPEFYAPLLLGIGAFVILFAKSDKKKQIGEILIGFAVLFIGLSFMSDAIKPYRDSPIFSNAFTVLGKNPLLAILTGTVVTAIIQSSSASVGILQTLAMNGIVNWKSAVFITLGQNIGTCVTALLSGVGSGRNGKRASVIHLSFNVIGAVLFGIIMYVLFWFFPAWGASTMSSVDISIFHTVFNITCTVVLLPFAEKLVWVSGKLVPGAEETEAVSYTHLMSEFILRDMVAKRGIADQFEIASAATSREEIGNPVYPPAVRKLREHGIDPSGKRARQMTKQDYEYYDYLLAAEQYNIQNMLRIVGGDPEHKIHRLLDYSKHPRDIDDPWYSGDFETAYRDIVEGCEAFLESFK